MRNMYLAHKKLCISKLGFLAKNVFLLYVFLKKEKRKKKKTATAIWLSDFFKTIFKYSKFYEKYDICVPQYNVLM